MKIAVYEKIELQDSIGNLMMIKLFHDAGVDSSNFQDYFVARDYNVDPAMEIFEIGLKELFNNVKVIFFGDGDEDAETYEELLGIELYENLIIFNDIHLKSLLRSSYKEEIEKQIKSIDNEEFLGSVKLLPNSEGFAIQLDYPSNLHETVEKAVKLHELIDERYEKYKLERSV